MYSSYKAVPTVCGFFKFSRSTNLNNVRFYTQGSREDSQQEQKTGKSGFNESAEKREWINTNAIVATAGLGALSLGHQIYRGCQEDKREDKRERNNYEYWRGAIHGVAAASAVVVTWGVIKATLGDSSANDYIKKLKK